MNIIETDSQEDEKIARVKEMLRTAIVQARGEIMAVPMHDLLLYSIIQTELIRLFSQPIAEDFESYTIGKNYD